MQNRSVVLRRVPPALLGVVSTVAHGIGGGGWRYWGVVPPVLVRRDEHLERAERALLSGPRDPLGSS